MRSARFILACAAVSALAACGTDTITAPQKATAPRSTDTQAGSGQSVCSGTWTQVVSADGSITLVCNDGRTQAGSGQ
jgi:hypothetical protein